MAYGMGITAGDLDRGYNLLPSGAELMSQGPGSMDTDPMAMSAMGGGMMGMLPSMGGEGEGAGFLGELQKMKDEPTEDVSWMEQDEEFKSQEKQQQFQAMLQQFQGAASQQQASGFVPPYASPGFGGRAETAEVKPGHPQGRAETADIKPGHPQGTQVFRGAGQSFPDLEDEMNSLIDSGYGLSTDFEQPGSSDFSQDFGMGPGSYGLGY